VPNNSQKTSYTYLGEASLELILWSIQKDTSRSMRCLFYL
jgi:hypothetical protein